MSEWPTKRIGEFLSIKHGFAFKSQFFADVGDYVVLTPGNFLPDGGFQFDEKSAKFYTTQPPQDYVLSKGDLLVAMTDLTQSARILGAAAWVPASDRFLHNQRLGKVEWKTNAVDSNFIYYVFNSACLREQLKGSATGTTVRHTAPSRIEVATFPCPNLDVQRHVGRILRGYDDLIENNTRRIAILEEKARRIFEEWFVRFRAPGCEGLPLVESAIGPIPKGWEIKPLPEISEITYGFPFKSKLFCSDQTRMGVIRIRDVPSGRTQTFTSELAANKYRVLDMDILVGMDGIFHMCLWSGGEAFLNQRVARLRPLQGHSLYWLFSTIARPIKRLEGTIVGTTVAHLSAKDLCQMLVVVPPAPLRERATKALDPIARLEVTLKKQNANLRAQRDLLLPKLISGEIDISAASTSLIREAAE
jgi:type I restriction enzyme S subunit